MSSDLKQIEMEDIEESTPDIDNCDAGNSLALLDYVDEIYSFYRENEGAPTHADRIQLMDGPGKGSAIDVSSTKQPQRHQQEHSNSVLSMVCRLLPYAACFLVAVHFARTTYRVLHDPRDLAFVLAAYAMLALLFCCVTKFETLTAAAESRTRGRLKLSVWALSTALTAMFACRVSPVMPPPLNLAVWGMALLVTVGGFCLLFVCDAAGRGYNLESGNEASPSQDDKV